MCRLYEKFLLEYYRKEHPELSANASQIAWQLDDSENQLLPKNAKLILCCLRETIYLLSMQNIIHI